MELNQIYLLSTYLKKWSFGDNRISLNYSFCLNGQYARDSVDMRLAQPLNMVNDFMNNCFHKAKEQVGAGLEENGSAVMNFAVVNDSEIKMKLNAFLTKIMREFNQNKRTNGRQRMISTRSLDFYYNDFEFEPLDDEIKFFVHLNRGANKMNGDLWSHAAEDLKNALSFKKDDILANKYMAAALKKLGRYDEALKHLKIYAESENSFESLEDLAVAYMNLLDYKAAEKVFSKMIKNDPDNPLPLFGKAMVAYRQGKNYKAYLDKINDTHPDWLIEKIKKDWDYKLPEIAKDEEARWNAAIAARYLGFERPFDLTKKAFSEEIPSYFDAEKGTIRFVKAELDGWVEIVNRYKIEEKDFKVYEDRLTKEELAKATPVKKRSRKKSEKEKAVKDD